MTTDRSNVVPLPGAIVGEVVGRDVAQLACEFPDWEFGSLWVTANSGSDARYLWARQGTVLMAAEGRPQLAALVRGQS